MPQAKIGIIGGTGLYQIEGLKDVYEIDLETPFGKPSDTILIGQLENVNVAFLPRHGKGHRILPTELPSRANIYALKLLGVENIIAVCSAGSFKEEIGPGHLLIPDQIIDRTRNRVNSFFGDGIVAHIPFAEPFCPSLSQVLYRSALDSGAIVHPKGTFVVMEGPAFSTRAESILYKSWGADIIGMTALPEAKLAREAEICYAVIGCVTDYDSWHISKEYVTAKTVIDILHNNIDVAKKIIKKAIAHLSLSMNRDCICANALQTAFVTSPEAIPEAQKLKLGLIINKYIK
jgi:5'-methylthioadenosine phosphorylase